MGSQREEALDKENICILAYRYLEKQGFSSYQAHWAGKLIQDKGFSSKSASFSTFFLNILEFIKQKIDYTL